MKTNKIAKNILKNGILIIIVISILVLIIKSKQKDENEKISEQEANQKIAIEEKVEESINNSGNRGNAEKQVTSRHSIVARSRKNEELKPKLEKKEQYTKIEDITISREMDLTVRTGISKEAFKTLMSNVKYDTSKFFYDNSNFIYDLCEEYQINEIFFCGLISAESGWNIASNHKRTHNYISLMTKNRLIQYNSVEDGLTAAARALHNNYLTEGGRFYHGKNLYGVKTKFCPTSSTWVELVYGRMQQIMKSR